MKKILILLVLTITLAACIQKVPTIELGDATISVELAQTQEEQTQGLRFREHLDADKGMLFIFGKERLKTFWMKDAWIPVDMIFIGQDNKINDIKKADPCEQEPCERYSAKAKYVLEVNQGFSVQHNVNVGDEVKINI
ncbi:DUF192 domain-containing protein [Candidatus Woesearchaeota archaeon]|nr:DUF192 domain-containing protein [Candidatus Woesearchaeota archaeon]